MASKSKVNMRFVVTLSAVLTVVVIGVGAAAFFVLTRSGAELEALGDRAMKDKDFQSAITYYGKSFSDDKASIVRLQKYCNSMLAYTPENQSLYADYYWKRYIPAKRMLAVLLKNDAAEQKELLDILLRNMYESGYSRSGWDQIIDLATTAMAPFEAGAPGDNWQVLKRYRGLALLEIASNETGLDERQIETLESDLATAFALNPDDEQVALGLVAWCAVNANRAADAARSADEAQWRARGQSALDAYRAAHPDSAPAAITAVATKVEAAARAADPKKFSADIRLDMMRSAAAALQPEVSAVIELVRRTGPDKADANTIYRLNRLERFAFDNKDEQSRALTARAIELSPAKAQLRYMAGRLAEDAGLHEEAITHYQSLLQVPIPTLSLEGVMLYQQRLAAMARQAEAAMAIWESLDKPEQTAQKAAALERVKGFREQLFKEVPPTSLELLLIDCKIAYASDKLPDAQRMLQSHLQQTNSSDADSVRLAGIVAMRLNQPGVARDLFVRLIELQPTSPRAKLLKGDVEGMLENHQAALNDYKEVLGLDPENDYAKQKVEQLNALITKKSPDRVTQLMMDADAYWNGAGVAPSREAAIQMLEQGLAQMPDEMRMLPMLTTYYYNVGRIDDAKALCARGLQIEPANTRLKTLEKVLHAKDAYAAALQMIDDAPANPVEKLVAKYRHAQRNGRAEDAQRFLAEAVALAPDAPTVIEVRFTDAITAARLDEASTLAGQASDANLDGLGGATYRARLLVARGLKAEAIELLKATCAGGKGTPELWRFLGQVQSDFGQEQRDPRLAEDALTSLTEALRMRPNDLGIIVDTLKTLVHLERYEPALDLARKSEIIGRASAEFKDLWLRLEASVGDKARVIDMRRALHRDQPANMVNKLALLQTDVDIAPESPEARAEARALLDELRAKGDTLLLAQLDAKWYADLGDREGARKVYLDFIAAQKAAGASMPPEPYVAMAQFLMGIGDTQGGMDALQEARQFQDPKKLEVDRTIGMMLYDLNRLDESLAVLDSFLSAGVPDDFPSPYAVRARHAEALLRLGRFADAETSINAAGPQADQSMALTLLRAGARQGLKDDEGAIRLINDAIVRFPGEPMGYVKRAEITSAAAESINDAIADLDTAIRLQPGLWNALQFRALLKIRQNRQDEAMDDLRLVVKGNPAAAGPRTALLQALMESGKFEDAVDTANGAANQRPRDIGLLMGLGDLFAAYSAARPEALTVALRFYDRAWKLGPRADIAVIYTRALLRTRNADLTLVEQILATPELNTAQNPELLMNHAILLNRRGAFDRSRAEAAQALGLVIKSPGDTSKMLDQLAPVFGDPFTNKADMAALIAFVQNLDMAGLPDLWPDFFRARYLILDTDGQADAMQRLRDVVAGAQDFTLQKVVRQFFSAALIGSGTKADRDGDAAAAARLYEEALAVIKGALELDPANAEALNNGAYVLAENLKRPQEAVPMAEHAVQLNPSSGPFWDTLGLAYLEAGRFDDAEKALNRAIAAGGGIDERMQLAIKLVRVKLGKADKAAAQRIIDDANKATGRLPELKARYQEQLDALQTRINALP